MVDSKCNIKWMDKDLELENEKDAMHEKHQSLGIQDHNAMTNTGASLENEVLNNGNVSQSLLPYSSSDHCCVDRKVAEGSCIEVLPKMQSRPVKYTLAELPPELILTIFSYLDASYALRILTCVCQLFNNVLSPESTWKTRFVKRWPQRKRTEDFDHISRYLKCCSS